MDIAYREAARWLMEHDGFLILTHKRPDGDTIGCAVALCHALRSQGKTAWLLPNEDATTLFTPYLGGVLAPADFVPAHVVAVDIASQGLFPKSAEGYRDKVELCIDHHPSNEGYAQYNCVEADKAACGEIICALIKEWGPLTPQTALPLYVAVSTDTGCFMYSNTSPNTHRVAAELMDTVGLARRLYNTYPHELDGGRRQRVGIARALALEPRFIVCDEPVSALDVSIQAQILNLLQDLQKELNLTYIFITHDLSVVYHISDEIMVMYLGQAIEKAPAEMLFQNPVHPYTQALLSAIPVPSLHNRRERILMTGELTSPIDPPPECRFASRCRFAQDCCRKGEPKLTEVEPDHFVSCFVCAGEPSSRS